MAGGSEGARVREVGAPSCPGVPMRLLDTLSLEEVELHHALKCVFEPDCLDWVESQRHPRWRAYTCRYCWRWSSKPKLD